MGEEGDDEGRGEDGESHGADEAAGLGGEVEGERYAAETRETGEDSTQDPACG